MTARPNLPTLCVGASRLRLAPEAGGAIASWSVEERDILRPATDADLANRQPVGMASFPMVPYCGRITHGRFSFADRAIALPPNLPPEPHAIHGQGWRSPWTIADLASDQAVLELTHEPDAWPWRWSARQSFRLSDAALDTELAVTNLSDSVMPAGLGLHPYFVRPAGTRLRARVSGVVTRPDAPDAQPPAEWNWTEGPTIGPFVDNQFTGWDGRAEVVWPDSGRRAVLTADPDVSRLVVYAPTGADYLCVEPVSHRLDAVNLSEGGEGHGMRLLAPGETARISLRIVVEPLE